MDIIQKFQDLLKRLFQFETSDLESFILSKTPYEKLIKGETNFSLKEEYINHHVLFLDDKNWPKRLFGSFR